ncbi:DUF3221 domain-containing protein [Paenibacillus sp. MMS18-CY102]|nr:DUF3221 domain-containing protein [Paenibacillus sp. MMS18-CY102]
MRTVMILLGVAIVVLVAGCSSSNDGEDNIWTYKEGYVAAKQNSKVLVVRDEISRSSKQSNGRLLLKAVVWIVKCF